MNLKDMHLNELPFGTDADYASPKRQDLLYEALQQVAYLTKLILWIRCIYPGDFIDDHGQRIRRIGVRELTGDLQSHPDYQRYLSGNEISEDPLDISDYISHLINVYNQVKLANGAAPTTGE